MGVVSNAPSNWRWYVYELRDSRSGEPFYVGKGMRNRMFSHVKEALSGKHSLKCARIREIIDSGNVVVEDEVARFSCEKQAYEYEAQRIVEVGLDNLTNVLPGGTGAYERYKSALKANKRRKMTLEEVVISVSKQLRQALDMRLRGISVHYAGLDWVQAGSEMALDLREKVGASFFDRHVFGGDHGIR